MTEKRTKLYWIIYELSYPDSYNEFYQWIVETDKNAKDCGINTVCLKFQGDINDLKESLGAAITNAKKEKIYVIFTDHIKKSTRGTFLFGRRRKDNPWDNYLVDDAIDDEDENY